MQHLPPPCQPVVQLVQSRRFHKGFVGTCSGLSLAPGCTQDLRDRADQQGLARAGSQQVRGV